MKDEMESPFLSGLEKWAREEKPEKSKNSDKIAFMLVREDVQAGVDAGYAIVTIWQYLQSKKSINCTYRTFLRHYRKYEATQRRKKLLKPEEAVTTSSEKKNAQVQGREEERAKEKPASTITKEFNINHKLSDEDLY